MSGKTDQETAKARPSEHLGQKVAKYFEGYGWFEGVVQYVHKVAGEEKGRPQEVFRVEYTDGDVEDLLEHELELAILDYKQGKSSGGTEPEPDNPAATRSLIREQNDDVALESSAQKVGSPTRNAAHTGAGTFQAEETETEGSSINEEPAEADHQARAPAVAVPLVSEIHSCSIVWTENATLARPCLPPQHSSVHGYSNSAQATEKERSGLEGHRPLSLATGSAAAAPVTNGFQDLERAGHTADCNALDAIPVFSAEVAEQSSEGVSRHQPSAEPANTSSEQAPQKVSTVPHPAMQTAADGFQGHLGGTHIGTLTMQMQDGGAMPPPPLFPQHHWNGVPGHSHPQIMHGMHLEPPSQGPLPAQQDGETPAQQYGETLYPLIPTASSAKKPRALAAKKPGVLAATRKELSESKEREEKLTNLNNDLQHENKCLKAIVEDLKRQLGAPSEPMLLDAQNVPGPHAGTCVQDIQPDLTNAAGPGLNAGTALAVHVPPALPAAKTREATQKAPPGTVGCDHVVPVMPAEGMQEASQEAPSGTVARDSAGMGLNSEREVQEYSQILAGTVGCDHVVPAMPAEGVQEASQEAPIGTVARGHLLPVLPGAGSQSASDQAPLGTVAVDSTEMGLNSEREIQECSQILAVVASGEKKRGRPRTKQPDAFATQLTPVGRRRGRPPASKPKNPVAQKPAAKEPKNPVAQKPAAKEPKNPVAQKSAAKELAASAASIIPNKEGGSCEKNPVAQKPAAKEPKNPVAQKPAAKELAASAASIIPNKEGGSCEEKQDCATLDEDDDDCSEIVEIVDDEPPPKRPTRGRNKTHASAV